MSETFLVVIAVILMYIQLFNKVADLYFTSGTSLTLSDLYRHIVPPIDLRLQL